MTIRLRGSVWWIDISITDKDGKRVRMQESAHTSDRMQAQELHDKRKSELWREIRLGEKSERTWGDAVKLYKTEKQHLRSMSATLGVNIDWLCKRIDDSTKLSQVAGMIGDIRAARIEQLTAKGTAPKLATINMPMAVLSSIIKLAAKRGYTNVVPHIDLPNPNNTRVRWIARAEADTLIAHLRSIGDEDFANLVEFSFETGLRQANAVALRPEWISLSDMTITIPASEFKGKRSFTFPLSKRAQQLAVRGIARKGSVLFPTRSGKTFSSPNERLKDACAAVGITDFHWHDIRHTWATWHVRAGTPLEILQKLGGWQDYAMVLRYADFAKDHIAAYADNISRAGGDVVVTVPAAA